jgi:hypothetical protein
MTELVPYSLSQHPAPNRDRVSISAILYGVFASPIAWAGHLMINFAVVDHACYPGMEPLPAWDSGAGWGWWISLAFDIIALAVIASAFAVSLRNWQVTGKEYEEHKHHLMEVGEGRTRFLGIVGMSFAVLFFFVTAVDTISLAMVQICAR